MTRIMLGFRAYKISAGVLGSVRRMDPYVKQGNRVN
jgi:hypothetical protein